MYFWYLRVLQELCSDFTDLHITNTWTRLFRVFFFRYFCCCCCLIFRHPQLIPSIMSLFQSVQNLKTILYMSSSVENYKFPVGTKDNPAMTCKELMDLDNIQDGAHHWAMRHHHFKTNIDSTAFSRPVHIAPDEFSTGWLFVRLGVTRNHPNRTKI